MQITTYLSFKGDCEAAFKLYERCLGGQLGAIFRYGGSPMADDVPADWADKIMHGSMTVGGLVLMGADVAPERYEQPTGLLALNSDRERGRRRADFSRARHRRQGGHAARENLLGRAIRPVGRSLRRTVADQLRGIESVRIPHAPSALGPRIIHDVPNRSLSMAKRDAKNVSSIFMKIWPLSLSRS